MRMVGKGGLGDETVGKVCARIDNGRIMTKGEMWSDMTNWNDSAQHALEMVHLYKNECRI